MTSEFWWFTTTRTANMAITKGKYERIICPASPEHGFGCQTFGQLWVELPSRPLADFEWTWVHDIFLTERGLEFLNQNNVTGFETRPLMKATYKRRSKGDPPPLFELAVTGWGGMAAAAAGVELTEFCPECRTRMYTIADPTRLIDPAAWDGSDLFIVWPLPRYRFASDRMADIIRRNRVPGVKLIPASQVPVRPGDELGPGKLKELMPEQRALELGKKFDLL
jgi:hypothetical protein